MYFISFHPFIISFLVIFKKDYTQHTIFIFNTGSVIEGVSEMWPKLGSSQIGKQFHPKL